MPFTIDQNLCVYGGSCIGNCPNRAIRVRPNDLPR
jgi:NAD-dependent dihydropyrimidine dehydrogenase PreA subunit